ncbi:4572_t:CDS:2 [Ambispora gerdemannii]|uniref:4572_t:CDS:1 n=1 Tax=Ambispora gerdemannii TaxID=144530 RepID=A0A9N9GKU1_9GLOM|nr:4572_t:CDS:2 [Ambispora gerdemannii]
MFSDNVTEQLLDIEHLKIEQNCSCLTILLGHCPCTSLGISFFHVEINDSDREASSRVSRSHANFGMSTWSCYDKVQATVLIFPDPGGLA